MHDARDRGSKRVIRRWFCCLLVIFLSRIATCQAAATDSPDFDAVAQIGARAQPARFHFSCSENDGPNLTGVLSVKLETLQYEQLRPVFDFDPFEGPDAHAGALSDLRSSGASGTAENRFAASGSAVEGNGAMAFALEIDASRREPGPLRKLAAVLRPLLDGPAKLVWHQGNAVKSAAPLIATLELSRAEAAALRDVLTPCMRGR
jgi:hypothetical protein